MQTIKLVSWNVGIRIDNTEKVIDFLIKESPDIICLQEVADHQEKSAKKMFQVKADLDNSLCKLYPYCSFSPLWEAKGFFKSRRELDFGGLIKQGNAIYSKYKILNQSTDFVHREYLQMIDWSNFRKEDHGRALQTIELRVEGGDLRIMNIHGIWTTDKMGDERTENEANFILEIVGEKDSPVLIAGDFNLLPKSSAIKKLSKKLRNLIIEDKNISITRPRFEDGLAAGGNIIDYIFTTKNIKISDFRVSKVNISDHYPLITEFSV